MTLLLATQFSMNAASTPAGHVASAGGRGGTAGPTRAGEHKECEWQRDRKRRRFHHRIGGQGARILSQQSVAPPLHVMLLSLSRPVNAKVSTIGHRCAGHANQPVGVLVFR